MNIRYLAIPALLAFCASSASAQGPAFDECGILVQDGAGCWKIQVPAGQEYILDASPAPFIAGDTINVTGTLDTTCFSSCLEGDAHLVRHYAPPVVLPTNTDATGSGSNARPMTAGDYLGDTQPGVTIYYQLWGRDIGSCGNGANFSYGLYLTWTP